MSGSANEPLVDQSLSAPPATTAAVVTTTAALVVPTTRAGLGLPDPSMPMVTTISTNALTTPILTMQREMGDLALRVSAIEVARLHLLHHASLHSHPPWAYPGLVASGPYSNQQGRTVATLRRPCSPRRAPLLPLLCPRVCASHMSTSRRLLCRCRRSRPS